MIGKSTRRALAVVTSLALALSGVMISDGDTSAAAKVKLSATKGTIKVGATKKVKIKGTTKKNVKKLTVKTSNKKVATVKKSGKLAFKVTGKKAGKAKITAKVTLKKKVGKKKAYTLKYNATVKAKATPTEEPTAEPTEAPAVVKTVTVFADLAAALTEVQATGGQVTLQTDEKGPFEIAAGSYDKVDFIVDAPNATITNSATYKSLSIKAIAANTWTQQAAQPTINVPNKDAVHIIFQNTGVVGNVVFSGNATTPSVIEILGGTINSLKIDSSEPVKVVVKGNADVKNIESNSSALTVEASENAKVGSVDVNKGSADIKASGNAAVSEIVVEGTSNVSVSGDSKNATKVDLTSAAIGAKLTVGAEVTGITIDVDKSKAAEQKGLIDDKSGKATVNEVTPGAAPTSSASPSPSPTGTPSGGGSGTGGGGVNPPVVHNEILTVGQVAPTVVTATGNATLAEAWRTASGLSSSGNMTASTNDYHIGAWYAALTGLDSTKTYYLVREYQSESGATLAADWGRYTGVTSKFVFSSWGMNLQDTAYHQLELASSIREISAAVTKVKFTLTNTQPTGGTGTLTTAQAFGWPTGIALGTNLASDTYEVYPSVTVSNAIDSETVTRSGTPVSYGTEVSTTPTFSSTTATMASVDQTTAAFTLGSQITGDAWKVYGSAGATSELSGVTASVSNNTLTLTFTSVPTEQKTYYVTVTQEGKAESARSAALTVKPFAYNALQAKLTAAASESNKTVTMTEDVTIPNGQSLSVAGGVTLNTSTFTISGEGTLALASGSTFNGNDPTCTTLTVAGAVNTNSKAVFTKARGIGSTATKVKLTDNITLSDDPILGIAKTFEIDLNGKSLNCGTGRLQVMVTTVESSEKVGNLTISGSGTITSANDWATVSVINAIESATTPVLSIGSGVTVANTASSTTTSWVTTRSHDSIPGVATAIGIYRNGEKTTEKYSVSLNASSTLTATSGNQVSFMSCLLYTTTDQLESITESSAIGDWAKWNSSTFSDGRTGGTYTKAFFCWGRKRGR